MSLTLGLNAALSGLLTAQRGLDVASHNVANINTVGFTRKVIRPESRVLAGMGAGVTTGAVQRSIDENMLRRLRNQASMSSNLTTLNEYYQRTQDLLGTVGSENSISHQISQLGSSFDSLAANVSKSVQQNSTVQEAVNTVEQLNQLSRNLQSLRQQADSQIDEKVARIDQLLKDIASLNNDIVLQQVKNVNIGDLEDKRDKALLDLSSLMKVQSFRRDDGSLNLFTTDGTALILASAVDVTHSGVGSVSATHTRAAGNFSRIMAGGVDITDSLYDGELKALVDMRDSILPGMQSELDTLTLALHDQVNLAHNRGTSYPNMTNAMDGTRSFMAPGTQSITMTSGDTAITLFNSSGDSTASTTIRAVMDNAGFDADGPWTINQLSSSVQTWLTANGAPNATVSAASGTLQIDLHDTSQAFAFRDQSATVFNSKSFPATTSVPGVAGTLTINRATPLANLSVAIGAGDSLTTIAANITAAGVPASVVQGENGYQIRINNGATPIAFSYTAGLQTALGIGSVAEDVTLTYDERGDGATTIDQTGLKGFSNFFGLNDLFVKNSNNAIFDSKVLPSNWRWTNSTSTTLYISDSAAFGTSHQVTVNVGDTLDDIASRINNVGNFRAEVVPDGNGQRLRIRDDVGNELLISEGAAIAPPNNFLSVTGMGPAAVGLSNSMTVRSDVVTDPQKISRGTVQYSSDTGKFTISKSDNTVATQMADAFKASLNMTGAGAQPPSTTTLSGFATTLVAGSSAQASAVEERMSYNSDLRQAIQSKVDEESAVNLDEEMAQIIIYQQSYAAAAKVISTCQQMFDIMNDMIR